MLTEDEFNDHNERIQNASDFYENGGRRLQAEVSPHGRKLQAGGVELPTGSLDKQ